LPNNDGVQVLEAIGVTEGFVDMPVVVTSSSTSPRSVERAYRRDISQAPCWRNPSPRGVPGRRLRATEQLAVRGTRCKDSSMKQHVDVEGRRLALTNLDKVLYPGAGFTKAHVIDYYTRVAKWLLPHFVGRPVTMNRFPDGVGGKAFYEKDAPSYLPAWVHTTEVPRLAGGDPIRYICVDDLPTLVWCANVASLELHPFLHRADKLNCPTSIVFDLDPGEGANLVSCAEVAALLRALLRKSDLQCYAKVSGSKGLQLYVPLNTPVTYAQTRAAAQSMAQVLERKHPALVVAEMARDRRRQKVFIDWSQNADFKTTIGVYSLRAKNDVPYVSAPVTWDEIDTLLKKRDPDLLRFPPEALRERTARMGDLFAPLLTMKQVLSSIAEHEGASATPKKKAANTVFRKGGFPKSARVPEGKERPKFVEPMLLLRTHKLPEGVNWLYELKLDGYRALALKSGGQVSLRSRNDNDFSGRYGTIVEALQDMPEETILDGEIVALDEQGSPSFNLLQNHGASKAPLAYYVFDVLMLHGKSMMQEPLSKRRQILERRVLPDLEEPIRLSPELDAPLPDLIRAVKQQGLEGLVAKRRDSVYEAGARSGAWQKMRINQGQDLVIGGPGREKLRRSGP